MVPTMSYESRTIAFQAEILFPPTALRADLVQGIHNALYRQPAVGYQNFQVAHDGIHLVNLPGQPGQVSAATFLPDRIVLREELRGISVEDFAARTVNVASLAFQQLAVPASAAQQFVVRALIAPKHHRDGREFVSRRRGVVGIRKQPALARHPAGVPAARAGPRDVPRAHRDLAPGSALGLDRGAGGVPDGHGSGTSARPRRPAVRDVPVPQRSRRRLREPP
jgi:hypothetical protein